MALLKIETQDSVIIYDKSNTYLANVKEYQQSGKFCDVTLCAPVQTENEDTLQEILGHSCILAAGSPFIHDILLREPVMQNKAYKRLVFQNMNGRMLKLCVDFLYGREVNVNTEEIIPLKCAAEVLKIDGLVRHCMLCLKTVAKQNDSSKSSDSDLKCGSETPHNSSLPIIHVKIHVETPIPKIKNQNDVCKLENEFDYNDGTNYDNDHMNSSNTNSENTNNEHGNYVCNLEKEFDYDEGTNYDNDHTYSSNTNSENTNNEHGNYVCNLEKGLDYDEGTNYDNYHMDSSNTNSENINNVHDVHVMYATTQEDPAKTGVKKDKTKSGKRIRKYANRQKKNRDLHEMGKHPRICSHCGVEFRNYRTLWYHMKEVEGKVFHCQYCAKTFPTKSRLTGHEKRHEDERNFACDQCDYRGVTNTELNVHKCKEGTIVCEICGQTMREKYLLIHKQLVHFNASRMLKGPHCPYTNPKISDVKDHMIKHDTVGQFECSHCGQVYRHKHCLKYHLIYCKTI